MRTDSWWDEPHRLGAIFAEHHDVQWKKEKNSKQQCSQNELGKTGVIVLGLYSREMEFI